MTGGLAAPAIGGAIGTYFMGLTGIAATNAGLAALGMGMAGGTLAVQGLFGLAGTCQFGKAMATRTDGISEFAFEHLGGHGLNGSATLLAGGARPYRLSQYAEATREAKPRKTIP